jgi:hypothetical protein
MPAVSGNEARRSGRSDCCWTNERSCSTYEIHMKERAPDGGRDS